MSASARRQFELSLHFGSSPITPTLPSSRSYLAALAAAERALSQGVRHVVADASTQFGASSVRAMRFELGRTVEQSVDSLGARFDHYVEVVRRSRDIGRMSCGLTSKQDTRSWRSDWSIKVCSMAKA